MIDLKTSWLHLMMRLDAPGDWNEPYEDLVAHYSEPHRVYHGLDHLIEVVDTFENLPPSCTPEEPRTTLFALFYHDAYHRLNNRDNEQWSALFAGTDAKILGVSRIKESVRSRIMMTTHTNFARTFDDCLICDIDLAHFGKDWVTFCAARERVRLEYLPVALAAGMSDAAYAGARADALTKFVQRRSIYQTPYFKATFEAQAQENLHRHIATLRSVA